MTGMKFMNDDDAPQDAPSHYYKKQTALTTNIVTTQYLPTKFSTLTVGAPEIEGSGAVVPLTRVPLIKIVLVPLTTATVVTLEFFGSSPMTELRKLSSPLLPLSHPQTEYC